MIYFMQSTDGGPVKIGHTGNLAHRRANLESHYGRPLAVLATMPGGRDRERELHSRSSHLRLGRTEQSRPAPDLMAFIGRPLLVSANPSAVESPRPAIRGVWMDDAIVERAKKVAALKGVTLGEYLSDTLRPIVDRDLSREAKKLAKEEGAGE